MQKNRRKETSNPPIAQKNRRKEKIALIIGGIAVGFVNGYFGGGGGMLVIPVLTALIGLEKKKAHATAIAVILPLSLISGIIYLLRGAGERGVLLFGGAGVVVGGVIGALLLKKIPDKKLAPLFYSIMILSGLWLIFFGK
ncbi:MAG: TSUP family transporter [Clostridiales bacterium]|jgi:uncharacterized membrane protein YfcA|nr:TSUP family transporter [Clostridiales bacterium]